MALLRPVALALSLAGVGLSGPAFAELRRVAAPKVGTHVHRAHYRASEDLDGSPTAPVWTWWLGAGGGVRQLGLGAGSIRPAVELRAGLGFELTTIQVGRYHELQVGPWLAAEGHLAGALGEGGLEVALTKERYNGRYYGLRVGGGYGVGPSDRGAAISGSLLFGLRHTWGDCANLYRARGVRAFATVRYWPTEGRGLTAVVGLELDPSLFFSDEDDHGRWDALNRQDMGRCIVPD